MKRKTTTFSIALPEALLQKTKDRLAEGDFGNVSEYVRCLIRHDLEQQEKLDHLRRLVREGTEALARGEVSAFDRELLDRIAAEGQARLTFSRA